MQVKIFSLLLCLLFLTFPINAFADANTLAEVEANNLVCSINNNKRDFLSEELINLAGTTEGDWYAFGISRLGKKDNYNEYLKELRKYVQECYKNNTRLSNSKATEWQRIALTVTALGGNPLAFGEDKNGKAINLVADGTYNCDFLMKQGINSCINALLLLDSKDYKIPSGSIYSRQDLINSILKVQMKDGGFALNGSKSDVDITAFAITALSNYINDKRINKCVNRALDYLSKVQNNDASFSSYSVENCESTAQVLIALCSLNTNIYSDTRFIKNNTNVFEALCEFKTEDGQFSHIIGGQANNLSNQQALLAFVAMDRNSNDENKLYDLTDVEKIQTKNYSALFFTIGVALIIIGLLIVFQKKRSIR